MQVPRGPPRRRFTPNEVQVALVPRPGPPARSPGPRESGRSLVPWWGGMGEPLSPTTHLHHPPKSGYLATWPGFLDV